MGADYYGFSEMPFRLTPDSRFFFASREHSRALSHLVFGLAHQEGFIVVTGEVGAGKTMLLERLWTRLDHDSYLIGRVDTSQVGADDLLRLIAAGFGVAHAADKAALLRGIIDALRRERTAGRRCLLVVDEVQALGLPALEELRMLSNIVEGGRALLQAILLGQPQFRRTLASVDLDQLRQRVLASYHLGPLSESETRAYVEHRLRAVGWHDRPLWEDAAFGIVHQYSGGIPRRINRLCGRILLHGEFERSEAISAEMAQVTALELQQDLGIPPRPQARESSSDGTAEILDRLRALERTVARRERIFSRLLDLLDDWRATR
ncbi:MAG: AAA family ATPase [Acetobacteraceae bacterium]